MNPQTVKHWIERAMRRNLVDFVVSMVCTQCQGKLEPDYGLQIWDGLDRQAWLGVCHTCWKKAWLGDRSPTIFIKSAFGKRIGRISRLLNPGMSWCYHCRTTWQYVKNHNVMIEPEMGRGVFCFCEACWKEVPWATKFDAYHEWWVKHGEGIKWKKIQDAIYLAHRELDEKG